MNSGRRILSQNEIPSYDELISNVTETHAGGNSYILKFRFNSPNVRLLNYLYAALVEHVPTYAVEYVVVHANKSCRNSEGLAHRIGLIPLKSKETRELFVLAEAKALEEGKKNIDVKARLDVSAGDSHRAVYAKDVDLPWVDGSELIVILAPGERIVLDLIVREGTGEEHMKWRPVVQYHPDDMQQLASPDDGGFNVTCTNIGQMKGEELLSLGVKSIFKVYSRNPESIYHNLAKP